MRVKKDWSEKLNEKLERCDSEFKFQKVIFNGKVIKQKQIRSN